MEDLMLFADLFHFYSEILVKKVLNPLSSLPANLRLIFLLLSSIGYFTFDMPLLYLNGEKFNQPIFHCNNISGLVEPVVPADQHRALYSTHSFKIIFKEGGCGTFIPLFFNLIAIVRQYNQRVSAPTESRVDPLPVSQAPIDEMMRHAYVDPNDPTRIFLQQPNTDSQLRRRIYQPQTDRGHVWAGNCTILTLMQYMFIWSMDIVYFNMKINKIIRNYFSCMIRN
ncbi:uncharacterized protein LOC131649446 [Vicia villosa]|uniref:uncharacterized protein LOC131649446 n=1 Tax=Vicia villosa TaxID=3911 RepID=UPI00273C53FE|nr:uncharacterized protein LOC131649446 [Vicia villosa]